MRIEVVYSPQARVVDRAELDLPHGSTVEAALRASGLLDRHADIDLARQRVGVWSRVCGLGEVLRDGDRVELYRPLLVDPKEGRRRRQALSARRGRR